MLDWKADKKWSDKFIPEIKRILGEHLIAEAPLVEDQERNTDLIVLTLQPYRVGCRIRRFTYYEQYPNDFTIRSDRPSGTPSELTKIIAGWGDYFFYGFADGSEATLIDWKLGSLHSFRLWFARETIREGQMPGRKLQNHDGSSSFRVFNYHQMPRDFVVARKEVMPMSDR